MATEGDACATVTSIVVHSSPRVNAATLEFPVEQKTMNDEATTKRMDLCKPKPESRFSLSVISSLSARAPILFLYLQAVRKVE